MGDWGQHEEESQSSDLKEADRGCEGEHPGGMDGQVLTHCERYSLCQQKAAFSNRILSVPLSFIWQILVLHPGTAG